MGASPSPVWTSTSAAPSAAAPPRRLSATSRAAATATIVADALDVQQPINVRDGGSLTLRPLSTSLGVDLGGLDSPTALGLSDAELARITANGLRVGSTVSGPVTISGPIT